jgi:hypothetical protein
LKRPVVLLIILSFLAMLGLDSNACYLLMLTCDPATATCSVPEEPEVPVCEFSCGGCGTRVACEPAPEETEPVCIVPLSTQRSIHQHCKYEMTPPPIFSTAAERKLLESHTGNKPTISFATAPERPSAPGGRHDTCLSSIHVTIPTTVLRC